MPPKRSAAGRAALALLLLLGFYVLAFGILTVVVGFNVWLISAGEYHFRIAIISAVISYALVRGIFFVERRSEAEEVPGLRVTEQDEPRLWGLVRDLATRLGTTPPDRLYLVPDVNAFVFQRSRLLGLIPGERVMGIGLPLLRTMTVDEVTGVLAHEYGHYTGGDTRLGPVVYRGRASIGRTIGHLGVDSFLGRFFNLYGKLYLRVSQAVSRRQELDADANAAAVAGPAAHASALRKVHAAAPVFGTFLGRFVAPLWQNGARPRNLYDGFGAFHDHPDHAEQIERLTREMEAESGDPYDSHPPLGVRLAAMGNPPAEAEPGTSARTLLADPDRAESAMTEYVSARATDGAATRVVEWDDSAAEAILAPIVRDDTERLLTAVSRLTAKPATVADALELVEADRMLQLATSIEPRLPQLPDDERRQVAEDIVVDALSGAVGAALTTERGWRWSLRWSSSAALVSPKGQPWDYIAAVRDAVADPAKVPELRTTLRTYGVAV